MGWYLLIDPDAGFMCPSMSWNPTRRGARDQRRAEDRRRVVGGSRGAVLDLVAAARAGGGDDRVGLCGPDRRQQHQLPDLHLEVEVFGLVAE